MLNRLLISLCSLFIIHQYSFSQVSQRKVKRVTSISTVMLPQGRLEANLANFFIPDLQGFNLYSEIDNPAPFNYNTSGIGFGSQLGITAGLLPGDFINFGVDFRTITQRINDTISRTTFSIGPRVRWRPVYLEDSNFEVIIENSVSYRLGEDNSASKLTFNNNLLVTKLIYLYGFDSDLIIQAQFGVSILPKPQDNLILFNQVPAKHPLSSNLNLLIGLFPNNQWLFYVAGGYSPIYSTVPWANDGDDTLYLRSYAINGGGGIQYSLTNRLFVYGAYNHLVFKRRYSGGNTISLGFRGFFGE